MKKAILVLEDVTIIPGSDFGAINEVCGELVVNTISGRESTEDDILIHRSQDSN